MPTKERHSSLSRDTSPGTSLAEHHGNGLVGQRRAEGAGDGARLDGLLGRRSIANQVGELGGRQVADGEQMPGRSGSLRV